MILLTFTLLFWVQVYKPFLCFLSKEDPLAFNGELVWWCWILSAFRAAIHGVAKSWTRLSDWTELNWKLLISPSYLNEILSGYNTLGCRFFWFITLSMSCHSLLAWRVSIERSAVTLMGIPLCVICCFSLAAFNICSLCLRFINYRLISVLGCFALGYPI